MENKKIITEQYLTGERALYNAKNIHVERSIFNDGESPLKESSNVSLEKCSFQWKYPIWYSKDITVKNSSFFEMARAGIWYTENISLENCVYEAPKGFRRVNNAKLVNVDFLHAEETMWNCSNIEMKNVSARGDYFGMNLHNVKADNLRLVGNYGFDGCTDVEVTNSKLMTKDAFWNCKNVTIKDSFIAGEYFGWNSENVTLINCTVESLQGMCYIKNLKMVNCKLFNTTLAFEFSTVDVEAKGSIKSIFNPLSGRIKVDHVDEIILDPEKIDPSATEIIVTDGSGKHLEKAPF